MSALGERGHLRPVYDSASGALDLSAWTVFRFAAGTASLTQEAHEDGYRAPDAESGREQEFFGMPTGELAGRILEAARLLRALDALAVLDTGCPDLEGCAFAELAFKPRGEKR